MFSSSYASFSPTYLSNLSTLLYGPVYVRARGSDIRLEPVVTTFRYTSIIAMADKYHRPSRSPARLHKHDKRAATRTRKSTRTASPSIPPVAPPKPRPTIRLPATKRKPIDPNMAEALDNVLMKSMKPESRAEFQELSEGLGNGRVEVNERGKSAEEDMGPEELAELAADPGAGEEGEEDDEDEDDEGT